MTKTPETAGKRPELVPDIFDTGTEKLPSSGQFSAAMLSGVVLFAAEGLVAPLILGCTVVASGLTWWVLDSPWAGRRRRSSRSGRHWYLPQPRIIYLSTLMLVGLWLATMFVFRASDPTMSSNLTSPLPTMFGVDVSVLSKVNGMQGPLDTGPAPSRPVDNDLAPFSLFTHGTASTIAVALLTYAFQSARRRIRRARRRRHYEEQRASSPSSAR